MSLSNCLESIDVQSKHDIQLLTVTSIENIFPIIHSLLESQDSFKKQELFDCVKLNKEIIKSILDLKNQFLKLSTENQHNILLQRKSLEFINDTNILDLTQLIDRLHVSTKKTADLKRQIEHQDTNIASGKESVEECNTHCEKLEECKAPMRAGACAVGAAASLTAVAVTSGPIGWIIGGVGLSLTAINVVKNERIMNESIKDAANQREQKKNDLRNLEAKQQDTVEDFDKEEYSNVILKDEIEVDS